MIGKLHHIGIASRNIEKDVSFYSILGYTPSVSVRDDPLVGIRVMFLSAPGQPDLELVQNLGKDGPMTTHLQARRKIFHFAYETDDIETDSKKMMDEQSATLLVPVTLSNSPEIAAWCYLACRNMMILELVQTNGN